MEANHQKKYRDVMSLRTLRAEGGLKPIFFWYIGCSS